MLRQEIVAKKFRTYYRYSFDNEYFYFYSKKGSKLVREKYPLKEMSGKLEPWKGHPESTINNVARSVGLFLVSLLFFFLNSGAWGISFGTFYLIAALVLIFNEIGFIQPSSATILSYEDKTGSVYMFNDDVDPANWVNFEKELSNAINNAKS